MTITRAESFSCSMASTVRCRENGVLPKRARLTDFCVDGLLRLLPCRKLIVMRKPHLLIPGGRHALNMLANTATAHSEKVPATGKSTSPIRGVCARI